MSYDLRELRDTLDAERELYREDLTELQRLLAAKRERAAGLEEAITIACVRLTNGQNPRAVVADLRAALEAAQ